MVRFKELFVAGQFITKLGALRFDPGIFEDSGEVKTPHYEMKKATDAFLYRPQINSGIRQMALFLTGSDIRVDSADKKTREFISKWLEQRKDTMGKMRDFVISSLVTGNAYLEQSFTARADASLVIDDFYNVNDSSRVYRNLTAQDDEEYWVYELPTEIKSQPWRTITGEIKTFKPKFYYINYVMSSSTIFRKSVYGIPVHKDKLKHFKWGWSQDMIYGRSFLMSVIDDVEILHEIIKNWSTISRYRALNTKIITIGDENNRASLEDINKLEADFAGRKPHEHLILNKPHSISALANVGEYDDMSAPIDWLRKDVSSGLVPNYLTPWNSDVNRATSEEVRLVFSMQIKEMQDDIINWMNHNIIGQLRKSYPWLAEDAHFVFEEIDMTPANEKLQHGQQLWGNNIITLNEYRIMAGLQAIKDGDKFLKDIQATGQEQQAPDLWDNPEESTKPSGGFQDFREQAVLNGMTDKSWRAALKRNKTLVEELPETLKVLKRASIDGREVRLATNGAQYILFDGILPINIYPAEEEKVAHKAYLELQSSIKKSQEDYLKGKSPEDELADDLFDELTNEYQKLVDEFFTKLEKKKVKVEAVGISSGSLSLLDVVFGKFDKKINTIVGKIMNRMLKMVANPQGKFDDPLDLSKSQMKGITDKGAILQKNLDQQLRLFNAKKMQDIRRKLSDGVTAGKSHADIKADIQNDITKYKKKSNVYDFEIQRIVRTEIGKNSNLLKLLKWKEQGFTHYIWVTMNDERVRPAVGTSARTVAQLKSWENHRNRNNKVFKIEDAIMGKDIFPGGSLATNKPNINCRCTAVLYQ